MGMINPVDKLLSFGEASYSDAACPNTLDLNAAQTERMKVEVAIEEAYTGGTNVTFKLQGSDNNSTWKDVSTSGAVVTADLTEGARISLPIPDGMNFRYLKVTIAATGSYTKGKAAAYLDTYLGI